MRTLSFEYPNYVIEDKEKIKFLREIIVKYRKELPYLRQTNLSLQKQIGVKDRSLKYWEEKYRKVKEEYEKVKKDNEKLKTKLKSAIFDLLYFEYNKKKKDVDKKEN